MHSDKQVVWPDSVWGLSDSNLSPHEPGEWKNGEVLGSFMPGSLLVAVRSWRALQIWIKRVDPTNLYKSESYRRVVRVTRLTWVACRKEILSKKNQPWINLLCLWFSVSTGMSSPYTLDQSPSFLCIQGRTHVVLSCTSQKKRVFNFHWFRLKPEKGLIPLTLIQPSQKE